jgi:UDP-N-acetylmuramate--alanine ligase
MLNLNDGRYKKGKKCLFHRYPKAIPQSRDATGRELVTLRLFFMSEDFNKIKSVHFIGIGGIGLSAVARMLFLAGKKVSGSDGSKSDVTDELQKLGIKVIIGHDEKNVSKDADLVIYTTAISQTNPELEKAKSLGIKILSYPESLALISKDKFTIAISGAHGKTTTTAMIGTMLINAKLDPTIIVGSFMKIGDEKNFTRSNFIGGESEFLVVEACEYRRSFLNINPKIAVITNIDDDHLDYYKDIKDIQSAFREFASKVPKDGFVVCNPKAKYIKEVIKGLKCTIVDYGKIKVDDLKLKIPGKHNLENAKAVLAVGAILGSNREKVLESLSSFPGTWRRSEYKGVTLSGALVYDDYGHHPTEIKATLEAFRGIFKKNKITVVFQPHLYSRTKILLKKFPGAFKSVDRVILAPIYAAREANDESISSDVLQKEISKKKIKAESFSSFEEIEKDLLKNLKGTEVLITMGAGDVNKIGELIIKK